MALTDLIVRQAKPAEKTYSLSDGDGLSLVVSPTGRKAWHFRYSWLGRRKRISLGNYPAISLRDARARRDEGRELMARGINPHVARKQKLHDAKLASAYTFQKVFDSWVEHRAKELKEGRNSTLSQIRRIFKRDVLPSLGTMAIYEVRRVHLLDVLAKIEKRKAFTTAEKLRSWFGQLFRYALVIVESMETNPATDLDVVAAPKPAVSHNPHLELPELPSFLQALRNYNPCGYQTQLAIRLLCLTGVRTGELRLATPDQFDLEQGLWIIPPQNVKQLQKKTRKARSRAQDVPPYIVPLPIQAIETVRYLLEAMRPAQTYLLANRSDLKKGISENTVCTALKRMGYENQLTGHGIRGTISTALNEIGYPKVWVDAQLSHADPNKVSSAYNHARYVEPRRRMMQDWADRLDLMEQGKLEAASAHLTIRIEGVPIMGNDDELAEIVGGSAVSVSANAASPIVAAPNKGAEYFQRLPAVPPPQIPVEEPEVSPIQRECEEMLAIYEASSSLPVPVFAKLAGKSKDQVHRELRAGKLLSICIGNRGQRVPDWQLVPLKLKLAQTLMNQCPEADAWELYRMLTQPHSNLSGRAAIDVVRASNLAAVVQAIKGDQRHEGVSDAA